MTGVSAIDTNGRRAVRRRPRPYAYVFLLLGAVTVLEVYVSGLPFGQIDRILFLMLMAIAKASLVALYYMHLRYERRALRWVALAPFLLAAAFAGVLTI